MIGRLHHVVIDCPEPAALAQFYSELLGLPVTYRSEDWFVVAEDDATSDYAFQLAPDHRPPRWPDPEWPRQFHLDVMVDDQVEAATGWFNWGRSAFRVAITCSPIPLVTPSASSADLRGRRRSLSSQHAEVAPARRTLAGAGAVPHRCVWSQAQWFWRRG